MSLLVWLALTLWPAYVAASLCNPDMVAIALAARSDWNVTDAVTLRAANASLGADWQNVEYADAGASWWYTRIGFFGSKADVPHRNISGNTYYARRYFDVAEAAPGVVLSCVRRLLLYPYVQGGHYTFEVNGNSATLFAANRSEHEPLLGTERFTLTRDSSLLNAPGSRNVLSATFSPHDAPLADFDWLFDATAELELGLEFKRGIAPIPRDEPALRNAMLVIGIVALLAIVAGSVVLVRKRRDRWGSESKKYINVAIE